ncbi:hypothetical protein V7D18_23585, partial [Lacrimispora sp. 38-1]
RYGPNKAAFYSYGAYQDIIDDILKTVIENGNGIELNTAGYRKGIGQPNPSKDGILAGKIYFHVINFVNYDISSANRSTLNRERITARSGKCDQG